MIGKSNRVSILLTALIFALPGISLTSAHQGEEHKLARTAAAATGADARAVSRTLELYAQAITSNDLSRVKPLLVPGDAFSYFEGTFVNVGWQSYHDHLAPEMAMFEAPRYRVMEIIPFVNGDLAYATFAWSMDVTVVSKEFSDGRHPVSMQGMGTAVLSRIGGQWKIRHLHTAQAPTKKSGAGSH